MKIVELNSYRDEKFDVIVAQNDTLSFLKSMPDKSVSLVVTSPPYNIGKVYEKRTNLEHYLSWQDEIIDECCRVLKDDGNICWQVGNYIEKGEVYPLDIYFYDKFKRNGLKLRNRIVWHFGHGLHTQKRFSGRYETILWFSKTDEYTFNFDPVRLDSKYTSKQYSNEENKGQLADIMEFIADEFDSALWDIPNVKSNHPEKTEHPCQYPIELIERLVLALTNENDVVLDPFMGVGSALLAALLHNRKTIGIDKEALYVGIALDRINQIKNGTLRKRELGKPVYKPTGKEKVSQVPKEWLENNREIK